MKLSRRIAAAGLSAPARQRLRLLLREVAVADGQVRAEEADLVRRLVPEAEPAGEAAALDALWPHKELVVQACVYVAVADGAYGVEEARAVGRVAHQLGLSSHQLGRIEEAVFTELAARGAPAHRD